MRFDHSSLMIPMIFLLTACNQEQAAQMPAPVANNAVISTVVDGNEFIYSFGGIGPDKTHGDITLRSFKYSVGNNIWKEIDPLPDSMPKIASAASVVGNLIYIIGGYHVFPDGHERSSPKVHIYDPSTDQFLADGPDVPIPIDDHVQSVWRDSLIYVATGWSDSINVNHVQVYDPGGHWHFATALPHENDKVFGSSGVIIEDDIYFMGGAGNRKEGNFPVQNALRIGHIDPENPLEIEWEQIQDDLAAIYRPGAVIIEGNPYWIGGSSKSYNYNGIAYTGEPVNPVKQARYYDIRSAEIRVASFTVPVVMDLRGIAQLSTGELVIVGGMLEGQYVSDKTHFFRP